MATCYYDVSPLVEYGRVLTLAFSPLGGGQYHSDFEEEEDGFYGDEETM